eukprot:3033644-Pyramimonas_sp.AAC.1
MVDMSHEPSLRQCLAMSHPAPRLRLFQYVHDVPTVVEDALQGCVTRQGNDSSQCECYFTDGSLSPGIDDTAAWAMLVIREHSHGHEYGGYLCGRMVESFLTPSSPAGTTSTDCEFAAIAFALIHALHVGGCSSVKIYSDSEVAVKTLL